jgi:hypothetical protein
VTYLDHRTEGLAISIPRKNFFLRALYFFLTAIFWTGFWSANAHGSQPRPESKVVFLGGFNQGEQGFDPLRGEFESRGFATAVLELSVQAKDLASWDTSVSDFLAAAGPVHTIVSHSTSGALLLDKMIRDGRSPAASRLVFFSPAWGVSRLSKTMELLLPFPELILPSLSPSDWRQSLWVPVRAYISMFEAVARLKPAQRLPLSVDGPQVSVIYDLDDELTDVNQTEAWIAANGWKHLKVSAQNERLWNPAPHHNLYDPKSSGREAWSQILTNLFLN